MKNLLLSFIGSMSFSIGYCQTDNERVFANIEPKQIMSRLYDGAMFKNNEAIWKPNYYEKLKFPISDDGFCHTEIDTILTYNDNGIENIVFVFAHFSYSNGIKESYHACQPQVGFAVFTKGAPPEADGLIPSHETVKDPKIKKWFLTEYVKNIGAFGNYGSLGDFSVIKLGSDMFCLKIIDKEQGNGGYFSGATYIYSLKNFREVFSFLHYISNIGALEKGGYEENTSINTISSGKYYKIVLTTKRTDKSATKIRRFEYSENSAKYVEKK